MKSHKLIKRMLSLLMIIVIMLVASSQVFANKADTNAVEIEKHNIAERLYTELNELALQKTLINADKDKKHEHELQEIFDREEAIDQVLGALGVKRVLPSDTATIERLNNLVLETASPKNRSFDFGMISNAYTVYDYSGTYVINGISYQYEYYRVIDNKGYVDSQLTTSKLMVPVGQTTSLLSALLNYNFSYGFSSFLGNVLPYGNLVDWALGNVFTALNYINGNSNVVYNNNTGIYSINATSVTSMTYYYIKISNSWYQCGDRAGDISFARADSFSGNINGVAHSYSESFTTWNSNTGNSWYWYLQNYVNTSVATHSEIGYIRLYRNNTLITTFNPCYESNPMYLI